MKVAIDIEDWRYKSICEGIEASHRCGVIGIDYPIHEAIANGTVIPDNHGDLIDREDARMCLTGEIPYDMTIDKYIARTDTRLRGLSPVISANKETKNV